LRVACDTIVADSGKPDRVDLSAEQHAVPDLPHDALVYLLASRYCESDLMMGTHRSADEHDLLRRAPPERLSNDGVFAKSAPRRF
jgi:hypothetical protein